MQKAGKAKEFFYQLESLRGIAALLVVTSHCLYFFIPFRHIMLFNKGYIMVDLFFVLSGFVIYNNYAVAMNTYAQVKKFIVLRIGRIYPLHFFTTLIWLFAPLVEYITNDYGLKQSTFSLPNTLANLLMIHNWGFSNFYAINSPSWSISTEFFAYLFFAIFLMALGRYFKVFLFIALFFAGAGVLFFDKENLFIPLARCLFSFSLGCIISLIFNHVKKEELKIFIPKPWIIIIIILALIEGLFRLYAVKEFFIFPIVSGWFILALLIYPSSRVVRFLERPLLVKTGTLSYSIYMVHGVVLTLLVRVFKKIHISSDSTIGSFLLITCILATTYIFSIFTYTYVEKIFRDKVRNWVSNTLK